MSDYMQGNADNAVAVPFSDDEVEDKAKQQDLFEEPPPTASPEERVTRNQKRQARLQALLDEGKQSKEELAKVKGEQDDLKRQLAEMRGYLAANQNARQQGAANDNGKDRFEVALDAVYLRQSEAYNAAQAEIKAGTFNEERSKHYERVAREIEREKGAIHAEKVLASREHVQRAEQAQQVWVQKYPDVYKHQSAFAYAKATFEQRQALGEAATNELVDEIMNDAMTRFRLGPKKAPSASERSRMSGLPAAGGGGGSSKGGSGITMTPALTRIAVAAYSDLPEAEAIKRWVNGPGKRLREKKVI